MRERQPRCALFLITPSRNTVPSISCTDSSHPARIGILTPPALHGAPLRPACLSQASSLPYTGYPYSQVVTRMNSHTADQQPLRLNLDEYQIEVVEWIVDQLPLSFAAIHCGPARVLLDWSIDDLSSASGVSTQAIQRIEDGGSVNAISMQAVAFAFEVEGLVFFPGHPPLKGENCRGSTKNPRSHPDYHLLE